MDFMRGKVFSKHKVFKLISFALPIIFITVVSIIVQSFYWQIMIQLYLIYAAFALVVYWISKSEGRKRIAAIIIYIVILLILSVVLLIRFQRLADSIITTGTIDYVDLSKSWKGDSHELTISFIDKSSKRISFKDIVRYSSKFKTGDSIDVIYDKNNYTNAEVYDPFYTWYPVLGVIFILIILTTSIISKDNRSKKRITHNRKSR